MKSNNYIKGKSNLKITSNDLEDFLRNWAYDLNIKPGSSFYNEQRNLWIVFNMHYSTVDPQKAYDHFRTKLNEIITTQEPHNFTTWQIKAAKSVSNRINKTFEGISARPRSCSKKIKSTSLVNKIQDDAHNELHLSAKYGSSYYGLNKYDLRKIRKELDLIQTVADAYEPSNFDIHGRRK